MIRFLQLPFHYDAACMQKEVAHLLQPWQLHFNRHDYDGSWSGLSLRSPGGATDNLLPETLGTTAEFLDTPLLDQCPYIRSVLTSFACELTSVRLLKLDRGAVIKEHRDTGLNYEEGEVRLHIPVITHEAVEFYLDGEQLQMREGEAWYINASLPHRLSNPSPVNRIHLVIDCKVNNWLKYLFERTDLPVKSVRDMTAIHREQQRLVIEELRRSANPALLQLADKMEQEASEQKDRAQHILIGKLTDFIRSVGIPVYERALPDDTFLPGVSIEQGSLFIDADKLKYPGDLLHEAGHIAVVPAAERGSLNASVLGARKDHAAEEMMAMAWSYAACLHLDMSPRIVFHENGYKGDSEKLLEIFMTSAMPIGTPMLQYAGMSFDKANAKEKGILPFPHMQRWMRE